MTNNRATANKPGPIFKRLEGLMISLNVLRSLIKNSFDRYSLVWEGDNLCGISPRCSLRSRP